MTTHNSIYNEVADVAREIKKHTNKSIGSAISGLGAEFGTITDSGLKLDSFKYEITDYMILDYLTMDTNYFAQTDTAGTDSHSHKVITPEGLKPLKTGDRVLVTEVGNETIVLGRVSRNA